MYDALMLVSFGGPEGFDDVMPFLRNVTQGRGVPQARLATVAEHYRRFGGVSPINGQCRELLAALRPVLDEAGIELPVYWGNRNWHPMLADTVSQMRDDGVHRALAFVTSPFGSYSSCRQYLDDIDAARSTVGPQAPMIDKVRHYHDHEGYVRPHADAVRAAVDSLTDAGSRARTAAAGGVDATFPDSVRLIFTAHSVPSTMDASSGPTGGRYTAQLRETAALVADAVAPGTPWDLVWQSRSGPPQQSWLTPDINDHLAEVAQQGYTGVVVSPIGFISDHLEVIWDLDTEAAETAATLGLDFARAATPGTDPRFVSMVRDLIVERLDPCAPRSRLGELAMWDVCPTHCCDGATARRPESGGSSSAQGRGPV